MNNQTPGVSYHVVAGLAAVVAAAGRAGTANAKGRAISLDVAETLAVIALLGLGAARKRAFAGLVVCSVEVRESRI